jgi:hypothetical protein
VTVSRHTVDGGLDITGSRHPITDSGVLPGAGAEVFPDAPSVVVGYPISVRTGDFDGMTCRTSRLVWAISKAGRRALQWPLI